MAAQVSKCSLWWSRKKKKTPSSQKEPKLKETWNTKSRSGPTSGTPIFLQASRKFSTFRRHLAMPSLGWKESRTDAVWQSWRMREAFIVSANRVRPTTAGEGAWMPATERGWMWLARWQSTTPSIRKAPRSSGRMSFSRLSMLWGTEIRSPLQSCRLSPAATKDYRSLKGVNGLTFTARSDSGAWRWGPETEPPPINPGCHTCRSCSTSSSSSRSCSSFLLMVNWGSADSALLWLPRNADMSTTRRRALHRNNFTMATWHECLKKDLLGSRISACPTSIKEYNDSFISTNEDRCIHCFHLNWCFFSSFTHLTVASVQTLDCRGNESHPLEICPVAIVTVDAILPSRHSFRRTGKKKFTTGPILLLYQHISSSQTVPAEMKTTTTTEPFSNSTSVCGTHGFHWNNHACSRYTAPLMEWLCRCCPGYWEERNRKIEWFYLLNINPRAKRTKTSEAIWPILKLIPAQI